MCFGDCRRRFPHAAADFQNERCFAAEGFFGVKGLDFINGFVFGKEIVKRTFLGGGNMAAAQHEAADVTVLEGFNFFGRKRFGRHEKNFRLADTKKRTV